MRAERSFSNSASASERRALAPETGLMASADSSTLPASACTSLADRFLLYPLARLYSLYQAYLCARKSKIHNCDSSMLRRTDMLVSLEGTQKRQ